MWSVFLFVREHFMRIFQNARFQKVRWNCTQLLSVALFAWTLSFAVPCYAVDGRASFASLLAGGLSPVGLGGYYSTPARLADPSYGISYYWTEEVEESSWNLSLEFGGDDYRVGAFAAYLSMDSLYRDLYSEVSFAKTWWLITLGISYGLDMQWVPGDVFWTRHRFKWAADFNWRALHVAGMLSGFMDEGVSPIVGAHWISDDAVSAFVESDFRYLYVGACFRWKFVEMSSSYRFPDFAVVLQLSFGFGRYGISYAHGFKHNSIAWNGVHVTRWLRDGRRKIN